MQMPLSLSSRSKPEISADDNDGDEVGEDCALADPCDRQQTLTFSNAGNEEFGSFSKKQRLDMVRLSLSEVEHWQKNVAVHENMACIYNIQFPDRETNTINKQIAIGLVKQQHRCSETGKPLYDIRFCPPKGAKPAARNRPDTLYQNITADMAFNTSYKSKAGKKVEEEDNNQPRSVMLAFNLELNKDGTFCKRRLSDSPYNMSSYSIAANVIENFYAKL
jgi:hypothetical protein